MVFYIYSINLIDGIQILSLYFDASDCVNFRYNNKKKINSLICLLRTKFLS